MIVAVQIGTVGQYLTVLAVVAVAWIVYRGGGSAALGILRDANEVLEGRVRELERLRASDVETIAELRGRTDVTLALAPLALAAEHHEARAQVRFERSMDVLGLIADRLGPDNGAGAE